MSNQPIQYAIAKNPKTGLYYDGTSFGGSQEKATRLSPQSKPEDFRFVWACPVVIEKITAHPCGFIRTGKLADSLAHYRKCNDEFCAGRLRAFHAIQKETKGKITISRK